MLNERLISQLERYAPSLIGGAMAVLCLCYRQDITHFAVNNKISFTQMYSAVFGWASVQTGALLGIYGMVFTKTDGFIGELRKLPIMQTFYKYVRSSIRLGLFLTVLSIPLIATNKDVGDLRHFQYFVVSLWFALFIWSFLSFVRVSWIFSVLVRVEDKEEILG